MGLRNIVSLAFIFMILMFIFGSDRLRDIGKDLASAIKGFRKGLQEEGDDLSVKKEETPK